MIAATFHGSSYFSPNYDFNTIHVFPSLEEVIEALFDRYSANGQREIKSTYLDGHTDSVYWPSVGAGDSFTCYLITTKPGHTIADLTEEQVLEAHTAVHGGWRDYTVTLAESVEGSLVAQVERAGI